MSDRRPESKLIVPCESCQEYDDIPCGHIATPSELVDELRRGVESGTIKGEVIWRCETHGGSLFTGDEGICEAAEGDLQPYEYSDENGDPNCAGEKHIVIGPVSDGGSET